MQISRQREMVCVKECLFQITINNANLLGVSDVPKNFYSGVQVLVSVCVRKILSGIPTCEYVAKETSMRL